MPWFNVDDKLAFHRKVIRAGNTAMGLWVRAGSHCADQLTDGFVSSEMVGVLGTLKQADRLVSAGLWLRVEGGFQFHEYSAEGRNPTRAEVLARRSRAAERKAKQRAGIQPNSGDAQVGQGSPSGTHSGVTRESQGESQPSPPLPSTKDKKKTSSSSPRKRGTRIPEGFTVSPEMVTWARLKAPTVDGRRETEKFVNYWSAKSGRDATKVDWEATWRNWMLNAAERAPAARPNGNATDAHFAALLSRQGPESGPQLLALPGGA